VAGEIGSEVAAYILRGLGLGFFACVVGAEVRMGGGAWDAAATAVGEGE